MSTSDDLRERVESLRKISQRLREDAERIDAEAKKLAETIEAAKSDKPGETRGDVRKA